MWASHIALSASKSRKKAKNTGASLRLRYPTFFFRMNKAIAPGSCGFKGSGRKIACSSILTPSWRFLPPARLRRSSIFGTRAHPCRHVQAGAGGRRLPQGGVWSRDLGHDPRPCREAGYGSAVTSIRLKAVIGRHRLSVKSARAGMVMIKLKPTISQIQKLLKENTEASVTYAALECRLAIERICYERLRLAHDYISHDDLTKWQPSGIVRTLIQELDAHAAATRT